MAYIIAGLGNPGEEYVDTRHNAGRIILNAVKKEFGDEFVLNKKLNAETSQAKISNEKVTLIAPLNFMNLSGKSIALLVKNVKAA